MDDIQKNRLLALYIERTMLFRRFFLSRLRNEILAEDLCQELYIKISQANLTETVDNPEAFLFRIANNLILDFYRQNKRRLVREESWVETSYSFRGGEAYDTEADQEEKASSQQRLKLLLQIIDQLPPQCRKVFISHKIDGLSHSETAEKHGISRSTVEKHVSKALRHLSSHADELLNTLPEQKNDKKIAKKIALH